MEATVGGLPVSVIEDGSMVPVPGPPHHPASPRWMEPFSGVFVRPRGWVWQHMQRHLVDPQWLARSSATSPELEQALVLLHHSPYATAKWA